MLFDFSVVAGAGPASFDPLPSSTSSSPLRPELAAVAADDVSLALNDPAAVLDKDLQKEQHQSDHSVHLHKRQGNNVPTRTTTNASVTPTATKGNTNNNNNKKPTSTMSSTTPVASIPIVTNPPQGGDNALFGVPSKVGAFNLTAGLLIYSAFLIAFCSTIGFATFQRRRYRNQFREQMRLHNAESGRQAAGDKKRGAGGGGGGGADGDMSDAALFKQASLSRRALMKDVGMGGAEAALAAGERDGRVRFGESDPSTLTGRTGGMKKTNYNNGNPNGNYGGMDHGIELEAYRGQHPGRRDPSFDDTNDYSRPPLQESENYYSSSSSSSIAGGGGGGVYMDQVEGGNSVQYPRPAYQQSSAYQQQQQPSRSPSPPIFVQRTNSSRMPRGDMYDGNNIYRSDSGRRAASRAGSASRRLPGSQSPQMGGGGLIPQDMYGNGGEVSRQGSGGSGRAVGARARGAASPTPVVRSNSTRLPPQMRVATPQPSSLSNQTNNYDFM
ncbi:hypothetical protein BGW41_001283 [Actinomortierella wolfii]|nr:hypothetical protein BGW41_001283 [Actinomortierella wolfii]